MLGMVLNNGWLLIGWFATCVIGIVTQCLRYKKTCRLSAVLVASHSRHSDHFDYIGKAQVLSYLVHFRTSFYSSTTHHQPPNNITTSTSNNVCSRLCCSSNLLRSRWRLCLRKGICLGVWSGESFLTIVLNRKQLAPAASNQLCTATARRQPPRTPPSVPDALAVCVSSFFLDLGSISADKMVFRPTCCRQLHLLPCWPGKHQALWLHLRLRKEECRLLLLLWI